MMRKLATFFLTLIAVWFVGAIVYFTAAALFTLGNLFIEWTT